MLHLQATAGNAAVSALLRQQGAAAAGASAIPDVLRSPGRRLDANLRAEMEARLDADFGDVRLHDDAAARRSAAEVGANAYTSGHHVVTGVTGIDKHTLAHELTHVVQQRRGPVAGTDYGNGLSVSDPSDRFEREAEATATRVMRTPCPATESAVDTATEDGAASGRDTQGGHLQRKIGFEFELGQVSSYKELPADREEEPEPRDASEKRRSTGKEPATEDAPRKTKALRKKDKIVRGPHFILEADETDDGRSDVEFVTKPFAVDSKGFSELSEALGVMMHMCAVMEKNLQPLSASDLGGERPRKNTFVHNTSTSIVGKPQATMGLSLHGLDELLGMLEFGQSTSPLRVLLAAGLDQYGLEKPDVDQGFGYRKIEEARRAVTGALREHARRMKADPDDHFLVQPDVRAFLTQIVLYLVEGAIGVPGYGKTIAAPLMMRTDFATSFQQINKEAQDFFRANPKTFSKLANLAASKTFDKKYLRFGAKVRTWKDSDPVFVGGLYNTGHKPAKATSGLPELKRKNWLVGIPRGIDYLTKVNYEKLLKKSNPGGENQKKLAEIESLGGYGAEMGELISASGETTNLPLVELRGLERLPAALFPSFAADLFQSAYQLNVSKEDFASVLLGISRKARFDAAFGGAERQNMEKKDRKKLEKTVSKLIRHTAHVIDEWKHSGG